MLQFSAAEVADQLDTTVPAVNSALQRARAALTDIGDGHTVAEPDDREAREVIDRYLRAFEAADVPALVRLPADEVVWRCRRSRSGSGVPSTMARSCAGSSNSGVRTGC
ncbi:hypothetical protein ACRAWF_27510 [Streptomyces sp. L7]